MLAKLSKRILDANRSVEAAVLKVLGEDYRQAIIFSIGPEVRIEPVQLVSRASTNRIADNRFVRIQNGELCQEFLSFPESIGLRQNGLPTDRASNRRDKFDDCLMRQSD